MLRRHLPYNGEIVESQLSTIESEVDAEAKIQLTICRESIEEISWSSSRIRATELEIIDLKRSSNVLTIPPNNSLYNINMYIK